jgi:hypothetical protein
VLTFRDRLASLPFLLLALVAAALRAVRREALQARMLVRAKERPAAVAELAVLGMSVGAEVERPAAVAELAVLGMSEVAEVERPAAVAELAVLGMSVGEMHQTSPRQVSVMLVAVQVVQVVLRLAAVIPGCLTGLTVAVRVSPARPSKVVSFRGLQTR